MPVEGEYIAQQTDKLPNLREDLKLLPAEHDEYGSPNWTIHDPVRNRYYRIGFAAFEMLSRWFVGRIDVLVKRVQAETILRISHEHVINLIKFLHANGLIQRSGVNAAQEFSRIQQAGKPPLWKWLVHHYLFVRIPLFCPDRFLKHTQVIADLLATKFTQRLVLLVGAIGIYLTFRQWDHFVATFIQFTNWQGLACMALTLTAAKILHEFGHAYTAARYGCRVPTIGVAFLVLYPVLYTDTSDAWRLSNTEQKLRVGAAGIRVELALAMIATFVWHFVSAGVIQSTAFLLATTTWASTLLINLNPLMRFDGYYLLADYLRVPNLQQRAFLLARWHLRETLWAFGAPSPEPLPAALRYRLIVFAYAVWVYRFFLFLGIALIVYHLFFKALGIVLFLVEIIWFILLPVYRELIVWWRERWQAKLNTNILTLLLLLLTGLLLLLVPWNTTVTAPALLQAAKQSPVMSASAGRVTAVLVHDGQQVTVGTELIRMTSPQLTFERNSLSLQLQAAKLYLAQARSGAGQLQDAARREQEVLRLQAELSRLHAQELRLSVRASITGVVRDFNDMARVGTWVPAKTPFGTIVDTSNNARVVAYVSQTDIARLDIDRLNASQLNKLAQVRFIPEQLTLATTAIVIERIDHLGVGVLDTPHLASIHGGPINVRESENGLLQPVDALYRVTGYQLSESRETPAAFFLAQRGSIELHAPAISLAGRLYETVAAIFLRELNF